MVQRNELPGDLVEGERAEASARTVPIRQLSSRLLPGKLRASAAKVSSLSSGIPSICSLNALQLLCESTRSRPVKRGPTAIDAKEDGDDVAEANADVDADAEGKGDGKDEDEDKDVGGENADVEESEGVEVDSDADDDDGDEENADDDSVIAGEVVKVTSCLASFELSGKQKRWASTLWSQVSSCTAARVTCMEVGVGKSSQLCGSALVKPMESGAAAPAKATTVCDDDGDDGKGTEGGVGVDDGDGGDDDDDEEKADETGNVISEKVVPLISCPASSRDLTGRQGC